MAEKNPEKAYEKFTGKPFTGYKKVKLSLPDNENVILIELGKVAAITYTNTPKTDDSDEKVLWHHECEEPLPTLYCTSDYKTFIIAGGKMTVKEIDGVLWLYG